MSWYDVRHWYIDYEEPDPPPKHWNCKKCGRFVSKKPQEFKTAIPNGFWTEDEWIQVGPDDVQVEYGWYCTCGEEFDPE